MSVWYHGTTKENAKAILIDGFKVGTFFGRHLEDALHMGGDHVFEVWFDLDPEDYWEYVAPEPVPPDRIRHLYSLSPVLLLHRNDALEREIRETQLREEGLSRDRGIVFRVCPACEGRGQTEHYPPFTRWRGQKTCTACPDCEGFGSVEKKVWMRSQKGPRPSPEQEAEMREAETRYVHVIDPAKCQKCCCDHPVDTPCPPPPVVTTNNPDGKEWVIYNPPGTSYTPPGEPNTTSDTPAKTETSPTGLKGESK